MGAHPPSTNGLGDLNGFTVPENRGRLTMQDRCDRRGRRYHSRWKKLPNFIESGSEEGDHWCRFSLNMLFTYHIKIIYIYISCKDVAWKVFFQHPRFASSVFKKPSLWGGWYTLCRWQSGTWPIWREGKVPVVLSNLGASSFGMGVGLITEFVDEDLFWIQ